MMLSNTGTVSLTLYAALIGIAIIGLIIAIKNLKDKTIELERLDRMIDLFKYTIVSIAIATVTLIIIDLFKEREQDVKELEYFDKYAQDVKKVDGLEERFQLSRYLMIVAPNGELKKSWKEYYDTLKIEHANYLILKEKSKALDTIINPTPAQKIEKAKVNELIEQKESPLVSVSTSLILPRAYLHISSEDQRGQANVLQTVLQNENFQVPGIENIGKRGDRYIPTKTEIRYYCEEEFSEALRLFNIVRSQFPNLTMSPAPVKIPGNGRGTRPGHFEVWLSK